MPNVTQSGASYAIFHGGTLTLPLVLAPTGAADQALTIDITAAQVANGPNVVSVGPPISGGTGQFDIDAAGEVTIVQDTVSGSVALDVRDDQGHEILRCASNGTLTSIKMPTLPTSDPGVSGQIYSVLGVLHVSP